MRRALPPLLLAAAFLGWAGSIAADRPSLAPRGLQAPGLDGPATARWNVRTPQAPKTPRAAGVSDDWLAGAERAIAEREYEATENGEGLQAPNRAHGFRSWFEPIGVRIVDRSGESAPLVALRLERAGRASRLADACPGEVSARGTRVEIRRTHDLFEWYENSPRGLEQGFTFAARPAGEGPLVVDLAVAGARVRAAGDAAIFETASGRGLRYDGLAAVDARGHALPAHLVAEVARVRLAVDDAEAIYPVTIDPLVGSNADTQLIDSQAGSRFGITVAGAGDVNGDGFQDVLVGADQYDSGQTDEGAGFLYLGTANGVLPLLVASATFQSNQVQGFMGYVAGAGDVNGDGYSDILVGGYGYNAGFGVVCLYLGSASGIASGSPTTAAAVLTGTSNNGSFGLYSASAGDVNGDGYGDVIVGEKDYNGVGAAWLWLGGASGLPSGNTSTASTAFSCTQATARFGASVAGIGDVNGDGFDDVAIGAQQYDAPENSEGAIFLWYGSASGIPSGNQNSAARVIDSNVVGSQLGISVAGAGDVNGDGYADLIAGAFGYSTGTFTDEGAAFVFHGGPAGITATSVAGAAALLHTGQSGSLLNSVASGDVNGDGYSDVILGSGSFDSGAANTGAGAVFLGSPTGVLTGASGSFNDAYAGLHLPAVQASAAYGQRVATADVNGDGYADVIVGAPVWDGGSGTDQGTAFIYHGGPRSVIFGAVNSANEVLPGGQGGTPLYGYSVASAGDVNGDGFSDVIVGAPHYDAGQTDEGAAFVFQGSATGLVGRLPNQATTMLQSDETNAQLGWSVASAGDVNGDGFADVIVGAPFSAIDGANSGFACVFLGSASGVASGNRTTAAATLHSLLAGAELGFSVAGAGDVNGDGYSDVIVGAPFWSGPPSHGAAWIFTGGAAGVASGDPSTAATALLSTTQVGTEYGISVACAGDVNGDGYSDVIVGADFYDVALTDDGGAFLYHGGPSGIPNGGPATANSVLRSNVASGVLGSCVASTGDINGDGYSDVIVGAPKVNAGAGAAYVFLGSASGVPSGTTATAVASFSGSSNYGLGTSVAGIGDVDGDGYADVAIGTPKDLGKGSVTVRRGSATGLSTSNGSVLSPTDLAVQFGFSVASAGDVDGDGFADLVTSAISQDRVFASEGEAFLFHGNSGHSGRTVAARQFRGDGTPIEVQPWGLAHASDRFHAGMTAADPAGRGREKIEVESCPNGVPFGSGSCTRTVTPAWTDAGATGAVAISTDVLASPGMHRWRVRTLHASFGVTKPGITAPPNPAHGPWRRFQAQALEADVRVDAVVLAVERPGASADFAIAPLGNPARGRIALAATLPNFESAEVALFDVAGRQVVSRTIAGAPGRSTLTLARGGELAPGVYLVRLAQGGRAATSRVVFVK